MSVKPWPCRCCGAVLGNVQQGALYPAPGLPVRVERNGITWVTCTACSGGHHGQTHRPCPNGRPWVPARPPATPESERGMMALTRSP